MKTLQIETFEYALEKARNINGWLYNSEAALLCDICIAINVTPIENNLVVVEIGSYHGKSTVLLGSALKHLDNSAKLYSIDPHLGNVSGLKKQPDSYEIFKQNIENSGLSHIVEIIKDYSYNVKWDQPISFLFIDGLHDYENVSRDFNHFQNWVTGGGYIAFHDYNDHYPGVKKFVDEILLTGDYTKTNQEEGLIVLQKIK